MSIFDFLQEDKPKKHQLIFFPTGNTVYRAIVISEEAPEGLPAHYFTVSSRKGTSHICEWYRTRAEAEEAIKERTEIPVQHK